MRTIMDGGGGKTFKKTSFKSSDVRCVSQMVKLLLSEMQPIYTENNYIAWGAGFSADSIVAIGRKNAVIA